MNTQRSHARTTLHRKAVEFNFCASPTWADPRAGEVHLQSLRLPLHQAFFSLHQAFILSIESCCLLNLASPAQTLA